MIFPSKAITSRLRWVTRITRKLAGYQLGVLSNFQGSWLDTSWTHQKNHWEDSSRGEWTVKLGSCLGSCRRIKKGAFGATSQWRYLQTATDTHFGECHQVSLHQPLHWSKKKQCIPKPGINVFLREQKCFHITQDGEEWIWSWEATDQWLERWRSVWGPLSDFFQ